MDVFFELELFAFEDDDFPDELDFALELVDAEEDALGEELEDVVFELEEDAILTVSIFPEWTG
jgi:hypothetical protein